MWIYIVTHFHHLNYIQLDLLCRPLGMSNDNDTLINLLLTAFNRLRIFNAHT